MYNGLQCSHIHISAIVYCQTTTTTSIFFSDGAGDSIPSVLNHKSFSASSASAVISVIITVISILYTIRVFNDGLSQSRYTIVCIQYSGSCRCIVQNVWKVLYLIFIYIITDFVIIGSVLYLLNIKNSKK